MISSPASFPLWRSAYPDSVIGITGLGDRHRPESAIDITGIRTLFTKTRVGTYFQHCFYCSIHCDYGCVGSYNATKLSVVGLSESLADDVKPFGKKVTVLAPSYFRTKFLSSGSLGLAITNQMIMKQYVKQRIMLLIKWMENRGVILKKQLWPSFVQPKKPIHPFIYY